MNDALWNVAGKGAAELAHRGTSDKLRADVLGFLRHMGEPVQADEISEACGSPPDTILRHLLRDLVTRGGIVCHHRPNGNYYCLRGSAAAIADDEDDAVTERKSDAAPTPTPEEATRSYGVLSATVLDCLLGATKPLDNGDIRSRTGLTSQQVNSALLSLRRSGQAVRYGSNQQSRWAHVNAPPAVLNQLPEAIRADRHGLDVETTSVKVVDVDALKARRREPAASDFPTRLAAAVLDLEELLADAIEQRASRAAISHLHSAASELWLARAVTGA